MKYFSVILVALLIDAFQALAALALAGIGFASSAAVVWIPVVGQAAAGGISLGGVLLGIIVDFCISAVFGSGLIFLLIASGIVSLNQFFSIRRMPFVVGKFIPFIDALPLYTAMTAVSILKKIEEEKLEGAAFAAVSLAGAGALPITGVARAAAAASPAIAGAAQPARGGNARQASGEEGAESTAAGNHAAFEGIRFRTPSSRTQNAPSPARAGSGAKESAVELMRPQPYGMAA